MPSIQLQDHATSRTNSRMCLGCSRSCHPSSEDLNETLMHLPTQNIIFEQFSVDAPYRFLALWRYLDRRCVNNVDVRKCPRFHTCNKRFVADLGLPSYPMCKGTLLWLRRMSECEVKYPIREPSVRELSRYAKRFSRDGLYIYIYIRVLYNRVSVSAGSR
jgi:hypothetical protein